MKKLLLLLLLLLPVTLVSQKKEHFIIPDSLKLISFEKLKNKFNSDSSNEEQKRVYGYTYYKKAQLQKDTEILFDGMCMVAIVSKNSVTSLQYIDSIISLSKEQNNFFYPAKAYILKSDFLLYDNHLNEALINLLQAEKYSEKTKNTKQNKLVKQQIALIKVNLGKYDEALPLIKENYDYLGSKSNLSNQFDYSTFLLSDVYNRLKKPDLALIYSNKRLKEIKTNNYYFKYLILTNGISYHIKKDYKTSNFFLDKATNLFNSSPDKLNLAICYYYRGENILQGENNLHKAKIYFEKVDLILLITKEYTLDFRNNYIRLIEISKKLKEDKQQLYYLNRLLELDKYLNHNQNILSKNIIQYYDTPHLLSEKEKIITKIKKEKWIYQIIGAFSFIILSFSVYYLVKTKKEKQLFEKRFYQLINKTDSDRTTEFIVEDNELKTLDLPIAKELLKKLTAFEKEEGYLKLNLKLSDLSKSFDTNNSYLSKTINHYKGKNFSQYLNDLRINYTINKLKKEKKFRKYTIKAISEEVGFNNSESFAKAFYNNTGLQPSYFIKKLQEEIEI
jgi:AraC-like DNA-binding protein